LVLVSGVEIPMRGLRMVLGRFTAGQFQPQTELSICIASLRLGFGNFQSGVHQRLEEKSMEKFIHDRIANSPWRVRTGISFCWLSASLSLDTRTEDLVHSTPLSEPPITPGASSQSRLHLVLPFGPDGFKD